MLPGYLNFFWMGHLSCQNSPVHCTWVSKREGRLRLGQKWKVRTDPRPVTVIPPTCNCDTPGTHLACGSHDLFSKSLLLLRKSGSNSGKRWQLSNRRRNQGSVIAIAAELGTKVVNESLMCNSAIYILGTGLDPDTYNIIILEI